MKHRSSYIAYFPVLLLLCLAAHAQPGQTPNPHTHRGHGTNALSAQGHAPVSVKVSVDKDTILIGQPVHVVLEATSPVNMPVAWPSLDTLPHFEWLEKGQVDSSIQQGQRHYRQYLTVTSYDSGTRAIPALPFLSANNTYHSDSIRIEVGYSKYDPSKDYHDIKDIIDVPNPLAKWIPWIIAAFTLLALAIVILFVRRRKKAVQAAAAPSLPQLSPYEEAVRQLNELAKQQPSDNEAIKTYYTRVNDVLRLFVLRRLGIASLSETNEELTAQIAKLPSPPANMAALSETLQMSDFVKFAKYKPSPADITKDLQIVRSAVEQLNELATDNGTPAQSGTSSSISGKEPGHLQNSNN